jgi:hypothetical protein
MNHKQKIAIRCAYLDLVGAKQARDQLDVEAHDWRAHELSIEDLENAFSEILSDLIVNETQEAL